MQKISQARVRVVKLLKSEMGKLLLMLIFALGCGYAQDGPPSVVVDSISSTSITLSWSVPSDSVVREYEVVWTSQECPGIVLDGNDVIGGENAGYTIVGLEENIMYSIMVTAINVSGGAVSDSVTVRTNAAPSGPPTEVSVYTRTSSVIFVTWAEVDCIHHNGDITGYLVRYGVVGTTQRDRVVDMVSGYDITISVQIASSEYSVEVAAVNSAGNGIYSHVKISATYLHQRDSTNVYLSQNTGIIPNHGYVVISDVGFTDNTALICNTNRPILTSTFHSGGDWLAPDGTRVGHIGSTDHVPGFVRNRGPMVVRLLRNTATGPPAEGIYQCAIQDGAGTDQVVSVGLYNSEGGGVTLPNPLTLTVTSTCIADSPQFILTCISTGGPATTVTWTRDSVTVTNGTQTVLDDTVTARYTHTLTVTGRLGGLYTCTVANNKTSHVSKSYNVQVASAPTDLTAVQEGLTSIRVSWNTPSPLGDTTGYVIYYTSSGSSGSVSVNSSSTNTYLLATSLQNGSKYTISILATSQVQLPSYTETKEVILVPLPTHPDVSVMAVMATFITISWTIPSNSLIDGYEVMWQELNSDRTPVDGKRTSGRITCENYIYSIVGLKSNTNYNITVTVFNVAGGVTSQPIITATAITSCSAQSNNSAAAIGGVLAVVYILTVVSLVAVVVFLLLKIHKLQGVNFTGTHKETPGEVVREAGGPSIIHTSDNEAYHVVKHQMDTEDDYERINVPSSLSPTSPQVIPCPSPTAKLLPATELPLTTTGDTLYEPV